MRLYETVNYPYYTVGYVVKKRYFPFLRISAFCVIRDGFSFDSVVSVNLLFPVLSWLKDQPPLTEEQLRDLFVTLDDFKVYNVLNPIFFVKVKMYNSL